MSHRLLRHSSLELVWKSSGILKSSAHRLHLGLRTGEKSIIIVHGLLLDARLKLIESTIVHLRLHAAHHHVRAKCVHLGRLLLFTAFLLLLGLEYCLELEHRIVIGRAEGINVEITLLLCLSILILGSSREIECTSSEVVGVLLSLWHRRWLALGRWASAEHVKQIHAST